MDGAGSSPAGPPHGQDSGGLAALRRRAQVVAREKAVQAPESLAPISPEATRIVLHELQVHQIELKLQNEELRRAQLALEDSRARYFELYDLAPAAYVTVSESGLILQANFAACTLLGVARGALVGQPFSRFIHKADQDIWYLHREQLFATGALQTFELRLERPDGLACWGQLAVTTALDTDGTSVGRMVLIDITERKRAELAAHESETRFALMADAAPVLIWESDTDKLCNYFNKTWLDFTGRTLEQEMGNGWAEGVHPDDLAHCLEIYVGSFDARREFKMEYRLRRHDGEYRWLLDHGTPRFHLDGSFAGYIGSCIDISERKRMEASLKASEERWKFALEGAGDGLWDWDVPTGAVFFSKRWKEMLGYTESEIGSGLDEWSKRVHPEDLPSTVAAVKAHLDGNSAVYVSEHRVRCKDGSWKWILDRGLVVSRDAEGKPLRVIGTHTDITERVTQQEKLQELLTQSERDTQIKGELLREVNHRVTNNLTAVLGLLVYERESFADDDRPLVAPALDRLQQRIRGLLTVHRMLSQSAWAPVNLAQLAGEIIRAALSAAPWRNQAVVNIEPSTLRVSPRQAGGLALVFNELTTNTVKYARPDLRTVKFSVGFVTDDAGTTICFRDNGPGYPTDVLENKRTNVGLKLIRDVVKTTLGSTVELENDDGAKTTIRLRPEEETRT
jgi:PAS domain S-box-containing protein